MSPPVPQSLQQQVTEMILDGAARTLAREGSGASMSDVAAAAGVARATVYRYFPNRQTLLERLNELTLSQANDKFLAARLDEVSVPEAIGRAVRALVEIGDPLVVLVREPTRPSAFDRLLLQPLVKLIERAGAEGQLRADLPTAWLTEALLSLVVSVIGSPPMRGREDTIAAITSLFLDGARQRGPRAR
jgi:AcrR family transcriptional regulator